VHFHEYIARGIGDLAIRGKRGKERETASLREQRKKRRNSIFFTSIFSSTKKNSFQFLRTRQRRARPQGLRRRVREIRRQHLLRETSPAELDGARRRKERGKDEVWREKSKKTLTKRDLLLLFFFKKNLRPLRSTVPRSFSILSVGFDFMCSKRGVKKKISPLLSLHEKKKSFLV